ncbi:MAG TPA: hypothetical protein VMF68_09795 [Spirochaetia bacterium]|nr:hypothetical protein [Spirochaetia bacterium]
MKQIEIRGRHTAARTRPASLDLARRTALCLDHMLENADPKFGHVPYVGVTLGEERPHFVHHRLDCTEVLPYSIYGMVIARDITGSTKGTDVQDAQRRLYLSFFNEMDGLIHSRQNPWAAAYPLSLWEQARALYALVYWFLDDQDERLLDRIHALVDGLFAISHQEGRERVFPVDLVRGPWTGGEYGVGALIDPLVKVYEMTGSPRALQIAEGLARFMLSPRTRYFPEDGKWFSYLRTITAVVNGFSRLAALTGDPGLTARARAIHDQAESLYTSYGSGPCVEPACTNMELTQSALSLTRTGRDEYWDMIDRWVRNHTAEAQFLDTGEWVKDKARKGRILDQEEWMYVDYPRDQVVLPFDDYRDVLRRSIGGFAWSSADEHLFRPGALMLCCSAHALRTFHLVWQNALTEDMGGLALNLHQTVENALGEVTSWDPWAGRTTVVPKKDAPLRMRIPEHARGKGLQGTVAGVARPLAVSGRYASFGVVRAGEECTLEYDLAPRTTEEVQRSFVGQQCDRPGAPRAFRARWRGATVVELSPESREEKRLYRRQALDTDKAPAQELRHFISGKDIRW